MISNNNVIWPYSRFSVAYFLLGGSLNEPGLLPKVLLRLDIKYAGTDNARARLFNNCPKNLGVSRGCFYEGINRIELYYGVIVINSDLWHKNPICHFCDCLELARDSGRKYMF